MNLVDIIVPMLASTALGLAGYSIKQAFKVEDIEDDVKYIRGRVDTIIDHLLNKH
jgi:hypothetical protein